MMLPNMCCMQCLPIATPGNNLHFWFPFLPLWYAFYPYVAGSWLWPREGHNFSITFPCWGWHERLLFATGTVRANMTASISRSSFAQTRSCACLLDMVMVWHAYFPLTPVMFRPRLHVLISCPVDCLACWFLVIPVMFRSCRRVLRNPDLFAWHV